VIDDDAGVRRFIVECLEMLGYQVSQAPADRKAWPVLGSDEPDLLIVDYAMPGMNGVEVVQMARERAPDLPIILATGYADMDAVDKVIGLGGLLRKPFRIDDLAEGGSPRPADARAGARGRRLKSSRQHSRLGRSGGPRVSP
jgi:CheY-like chemotaxis protein